MPGIILVLIRQITTLRQDIKASIKLSPLWLHLSWTEIKLRYRGTVIGPFWTSISMAVFITAIGLIFSQTWGGLDTAEYLPYLAAGYLSWMLIFQIIVDGSSSLIKASGYIKQMPLPFTLFAFVNVTQNSIVFLHHLLVFFVLVLIFDININTNTLLLLPALILLCINGLWMSTFMGMVVARYRDIEPLTTNILQIALFVTPIIWPFERLPEGRKILVDINPFFHFIQIVRSPLLGQSPSLLNWQVCLGITVIGIVVTTYVFNRVRSRIVFWL
jgi:ABC-2 type transport system permease protein